MITRDNILRDYSGHLQKRGCARATVQTYFRQLTPFLRHLEQKGVSDLDSVSPVMVSSYITSLILPGRYAPSTIAVIIRALRSFFAYLHMTGRTSANPAGGLREPAIRIKASRTVLTSGQLHLLLAHPDLSKQVGFRNRTIMELLASTALRASELVALSSGDIDFDESTIHVRRGKGSRERVIPLGKHAARFLKGYLALRQSMHLAGPSRADRLFTTLGGRPLTVQTLRVMVKRSAAAAGLSGNITPHTFRHTCATHLAMSGADLRSVQLLLGHADLRTTQRYVHISEPELKRVHHKCHPRERDPVIAQCRFAKIRGMKGAYRDGTP